MIEELIEHLKPAITEKNGGNLTDGELKLLYSNYGEVFLRTWTLKLKNKSKEYLIEENKLENKENLEEKDIG